MTDGPNGPDETSRPTFTGPDGQPAEPRSLLDQPYRKVLKWQVVSYLVTLGFVAIVGIVLLLVNL